MNFKNRFKYFKKQLNLITKLIFIGLFIIVSIPFYYSDKEEVSADQVKQKFESEISQIKAQISETHIHLDGVADERITLEQTLANLNSQITNLQLLIDKTQTEIDRLESEISNLEQEIEDQINILEKILTLMYKKSGASSFELIISSGNFTEYLNQQEYLDRLREGVVESVDRITILQKDLNNQKLYQESLLEDQQAQQIVLSASRWEQQQLLLTTNNEEQQYQAQLQQLRNEQSQLEAQLEAYLQSLLSSRTSLGEVKAGDIIGKNGNTGWSTGPHLHLVIYSASDTSIKYDPLTYMKNNDLVWPMAGSGGWVSQGYHANHRALDIAAAEGVPILAIDSGTIVHRGCLFTDIPQYSTFGVIIDHGNYFSLYIHLQAPNNDKYSACNINRRSQYGTLSVDYNITY